MSFSGVNMKAVEVSYKASLRISTAGKPRTVGESLLLPATKGMANAILGEKVAKQLQLILLSHSTIS
jgi:hypothetical protein